MYFRQLGFATLATLLLTGCAVVTEPLAALRMPGARERSTAEELHEALALWVNSFQGSVVAASDRIRAATTEREPRRNSLFWQMRMIPLARQAGFRADPQAAYVAVVALSSAQYEYLKNGEGRALFGSEQAIAVRAARDIEDRALAVGKRFLTTAELQRLERQVDEVIAQHPIRGTFAVDSLLEGFAQTQESGIFSWVIDLPMAPFRAISGVTDTAQAVGAFNETAKEFTEIVSSLPHILRLQLELLFYDSEELDAVSRMLAASEELAESSSRLSSVAETLPDDLMQELGPRLEDARATIAELDAVLVRAETLAGPLTHVADRVGEASAQWTELLGSLQEGEGESEKDGRPFDVREYEAAAGRIADATRELRALVDDLGALNGDGGTALLNAATWRVGLLILVFFGALAAYRITVSRLRS
jgi:hypothetical protein